MSSKLKFLFVSLFVAVLVVAGIGGTIVMAQGPTTTPTAGTTPTVGTTPAPTGPATSGNATPGAPNTLSDLYWQVLAQKLGLSVDKLQQTIVDARKEAINQAVTKGLLTQTQADRLLQQLQNAAPGTVFDGVGRGRAPGQAVNVVTSVRNAGLNAAAQALGMSTSDLTTALRTKTLLTIANEKNADVTKLRTSIADAAKGAIDQAVKDGGLTQAQADSIKANITPNNINLNTHSLGIPFPSGLNQRMPFPPGQRDDRGFPGRGNGPRFGRQ